MCLSVCLSVPFLCPHPRAPPPPPCFGGGCDRMFRVCLSTIVYKCVCGQGAWLMTKHLLGEPTGQLGCLCLWFDSGKGGNEA